MFRQVGLLTMLACNHIRTQDVIRHKNRMFTASVRNLLYMHGQAEDLVVQIYKYYTHIL